ncbi:MAG: hypothetical protein LV473_07795 [Nitrospira sp.]|nr:hypothetical protein [Nitrospira sp.]
MQDYLTQLVWRVQQPELPELMVQPRPLSLFEPPRYSSESFEVEREVDRTGEPEPEIPGSGHGVTLAEWTNYTDGKNHDESETAGVMPDAGLTEKMGRPGPRESVDSHVDRMDLDHKLRRMGEDLARGKPENGPDQEGVRGGREAIEPAAPKDRSSRNASISSSELRESATHTGQIPKAEHELKQRSHKLESPSRRKRIVKQDPAVKSTRGQNEPRAAMERASSIMPPRRGVRFFDDALVLSTLSSNGKFDATADITPIPSRDKRTPFVEPVASFREKERSVPPPTIQVSIGRIEVRAMVASAPARKLEGKSSAMSLDEYLARRNEARR